MGYSTNPYPGSPCIVSSPAATECALVMQDLSAYVTLPGFQFRNIDVNIAPKTITGLSTTSSQLANFYYEFSYNDAAGHPIIVKDNYGYYGCLYTAPLPATTLCNKPYIPTATIYNDCLSSMLNQAETNAKLLYQSYINKYSTSFIDNYKNKCIQAQETFNRTYNINEYHYTLYYYDQAGNLTRTVPPKGVKKLTTTEVTNVQSGATIFPTHNYVTNYQYQSYGAPVTSNTPDEQTSVAGLMVPINTDYYYDPIGRIQVSQNGKQKLVNDFSYTLYDNLGRIIEVGVMGPIVLASIPALKTAIATNAMTAYFVTSGVTRREVIKTYYDTYLNSTIAGQFGVTLVGSTPVYGQINLRNRVATVTYEDLFDGNDNTFSYATHYTYDEHGNATKIIQDFPQLAAIGKRYNKIDYEFDLISGNVNKVTYQKGSGVEQFMHRYEYDDDNRLHQVYTSKDGVNWDKDAKYFYYEHGPLARTETGDQKVQGTDFAYTIHGWIKAVNSNILSENTDMGKDGATGNSYFSNYTNIHKYIGKDASGYSLNYYTQGAVKDYKAIKTFGAVGNNQDMIASTTNLVGTGGGFDLAIDAPDLYNGNISSMVTSIYDMDINPNNTHAENTAFPQITAYKYDQLHRLLQMKAFRDMDLVNNSSIFEVSTNALRYNTITYNSYNYSEIPVLKGIYLGNVLSVVSDRKLQQAGAGTTNIYSRIFDDGSLTGVTGIPTSAAISIVANQLNVSPQAASSGAYFNFPTTAGINYTFEFDLDKGSVDASDGLTLGVYDNAGTLATSYPLGAVANGHYSFSYLATSASANVKLYFTSGGNTPANTALHFNHSFGVDNFLVTVNSSNLVVSKYMPEILETHDYYPFGYDMPGRNYPPPGAINAYQYGNNGQMREHEEFEGAYSAEYWGYDSRLGRRFETDLITYPWQSTYATFNNNPIYFSDLLGLKGESEKESGGGDHTYSTDDSKFENNDAYWKRGEEEPTRNNFLIINESTKPGQWGTDIMQIGNKNWKIIIATDMNDAKLAINLYNGTTGNKTGMVAFLNHGNTNAFEFSYGTGGNQNTSVLVAAQIAVYMESGPGNIGSVETDKFLGTLVEISKTFDDDGGVFLFLNCLAGIYDSDNGKHDANQSLSYQLTRLVAKNNKKIISVFHNDVTRFYTTRAHFYDKDEAKFFDFDKDLTSPGEQKYGWSVLRVQADGKIKRQVFGTDIKMNKRGKPLSFGNLKN